MEPLLNIQQYQVSTEAHHRYIDSFLYASKKANEISDAIGTRTCIYIYSFFRSAVIHCQQFTIKITGNIYESFSVRITDFVK